MARKPPKYALHTSGQARVRINGKDFYLNEYNSKDSLEAYERLLAKYFLGSLDVDRDSLQISRLSIMYVEYARGYYRKDGVQTSDVHAIQMALRPLVKMFGREKNPRLRSSETEDGPGIHGSTEVGSNNG
jgi:hypothetical protein